MTQFDQFIGALSEIGSGVVTGSTHSFWYVKDKVIRGLGLSNDKHLVKTTSSDDKLKVVGVGYGRTGTYSLALALEELGYPTLHTQHMYESREILDMWTDQVFGPSIDASEATLGTPDFDLIAKHGFQATMDLPTALYFEQILTNNTDCKFILTTRDSSQTWFKSWNTLTKAITVPTRRFGWMSHAQKINKYYRWLFSIVNKDNKYLTAEMPLPDQDVIKAIESYEQHNERVRNVIPPHRLLEYHVKEGWEPLCNFLDIQNCPMDKPFPKTNSALSVQVQAVSAQLIPLVVIVVSALLIVPRVLQKRRDNNNTKRA